MRRKRKNANKITNSQNGTCLQRKYFNIPEKNTVKVNRIPANTEACVKRNFSPVLAGFTVILL